VHKSKQIERIWHIVERANVCMPTPQSEQNSPDDPHVRVLRIMPLVAELWDGPQAKPPRYMNLAKRW
jgi:hypothetical protein